MSLAVAGTSPAPTEAEAVPGIVTVPEVETVSVAPTEDALEDGVTVRG